MITSTGTSTLGSSKPKQFNKNNHSQKKYYSKHYNDKKISNNKKYIPNNIDDIDDINDIKDIDDMDYTDYDKTMIIPETNIKLPLKSVSGRRCLSKCYAKGETYLHPVLLTGVADNNNNSCAIDPVHSKDPQYFKEYDMILADKCRLEDNKIFQPPDELESILLSFYFNPNDFLESIYELHSFDQVIYWTLENDHLPFDTIKRVHNCAWKVFGNKIEELSGGVLEYYYELAKEHWLKDYINIIQNKYSFDFIYGKGRQNDPSSGTDMYNIMLNNYFTYEFFVTALKRYVYEYQDKWEIIESHYGHIKKYIFYQLVENIENKTKK